MRGDLHDHAARLLFWSASPVVLAQGLWLRKRTALGIPAQGPNTGRHGRGPELQVLALGDSIIAGVGASSTEQALPCRFAAALASRLGRSVNWRALGVSGLDASGLPGLLRDAADDPAGCDVALISIGVNDVTGLRSRRRFRADLEATVQALRQRYPDCHLVFAAVPPLHAFPLLPQPLRSLLGLRARSMNRVLNGVATHQDRVLHAPMPFQPNAKRFADDGFHPNPAALEQWAGFLADHCASAWPGLVAE